MVIVAVHQQTAVKTLPATATLQVATARATTETTATQVATATPQAATARATTETTATQVATARATTATTTTMVAATTTTTATQAATARTTTATTTTMVAATTTTITTARTTTATTTTMVAATTVAATTTTMVTVTVIPADITQVVPAIRHAPPRRRRVRIVPATVTTTIIVRCLPCPTAPIISSIFGLPFGVSINVSLGTLRNGGYYIDGYGSDVVYLRNVSQMGFYWDDAVINYDNRGLATITLYDSTYGYNTTRYNSLYNDICMQYGLPAYNTYGGETTAIWYDRYGNNYISLSYKYMSAFGGGYRYYTILSYGY